MKNKDFGFFQQHVEKIALGIGGLVIVGVGATQFLLGEPNAITVNNQDVAPDEIEDTVLRDLNRLKSSLANENQLEDVNGVFPRYAEFFTLLYNKPVATERSLAPIDNTGLASGLQKIIAPDYPEKFLPTPPLPTEVRAKTGKGVLADNGSDRYFAIRQMVGDQQPADFNYVSVDAQFSFKDLIERYSAIDVPGEQRIDEALWRSRLAITSVQLLREEKDPVTGEWGNRTTINPLPGDFAIVPSNQPTLTFEESQDLEEQIRQSQALLQRPPFPEISNGLWTPPDITNRVYTPEELQRAEELERRITTITRRLDRMTGNDARDERTDRRGSDRRSDRSSRRGGAEETYEDYGDPTGGLDRSSRRGSRRGGADDDQDNRRADRTAQQIAELEEELFETQQELNELLGIEEDPEQSQRPGARRPGTFGGSEFDLDDGLSPFDGAPDFGGPAPSRRPTYGGNLGGTPGQEVPDEVRVWAHDLTVEPGKTYRYKVLVSVMNPLYRFPRLSPDQLTENRNRVSLGPAEEEIESAEWSPSAEVTLDPEYYFFVDSANKEQKRADIEVWTVYDGIWRKNEFVEYPGNEVGGIAEPEGVDTRGRGIAMNVGAILLDVDSIPSGNGSAVRVLLLDPETNRITTRLVNEDKNSDERKRLRLEADLQAKQAESRLSDSRF